MKLFDQKLFGDFEILFDQILQFDDPAVSVSWESLMTLELSILTGSHKM